MTNLTRWSSGRPSMRALRRDIDDILEEFEPPHALRRELDRLFAREVSPRAMWRGRGDRPLTPRRRGIGRLIERIKDATGLFRRGAEMSVEDGELLTERDDAYLLRVELPGVRERDVDVRVDGDMLVISGERRQEETKREHGYEYTERSYGTFTRAIELPRTVDPSAIEADLRDGVLEVVLPKRHSMRAKQILVDRRDDRDIGRREVAVTRGQLAPDQYREGPKVVRGQQQQSAYR